MLDVQGIVMRRMAMLLVVCGAAACERTPQPPRHCEIAGGWEVESHDPTDRSTNVYVIERGAREVDLEADVRRGDGTHGWNVSHGRRLDETHLGFDGKERCEIAPSCDVMTCTSFGSVRHFCNIAGPWHATFGQHTGTASITTHRDDLELELVGTRTQQLEGLRLSARVAIFQFPEGDVRCAISENCDHITCTSFELRK